jgi:UDP-N-acetylglucosamine:LPS N-acetylglucosamine transferase
MIDTGMGHKAPALAVREHLERVAPGRFDVVIMDFLAELGMRTLDKAVKRGWSKVLLRYTWLIDALYWPGHALAPIMVTVIGWIVTPQLHRLERLTRKQDPDLLVTTHFVSTNSYAVLAKRGRIDVPVVGLVVDPFENNNLMAHAGLKALVAFSRRSASVYRRNLPPSTEVVRLGFPLSGRYTGSVPDRAAARRKLGIASDRFVLLMTAGAEGVGKFDILPESVIGASLDIHVIVVCGRNDRLRRDLDAFAQEVASSGTSRTECTILGFVDNMHDLIAGCDVFLGAGGANLTFEALSVGRPAILTLYTPNIRGTVDFVEGNGFGWRCGDAASCVSLVSRLRSEPEVLREAEARIARAGIRSGTPELAAYLVGLLGAKLPEVESLRPRKPVLGHAPAVSV